MGKKLAIKGHESRGKEVIEILEMMGGYADELVGNGTDEKYAYFILEEENNAIDGFPIDKKDEFDFDARIFTLEEFLEEYPYKVGGKVTDGYGNVLTIKSMSWYADIETMVYDFEDAVIVLAAEDMKPVNDVGLKIENGINMNIEFDLSKYSYEIKDGKLVVSEKTPKYPDNYEECVIIAKNIHGYDINIDAPAYRELLE